MKKSKITEYTAAVALSLLFGSCAKVENQAPEEELVPIELKVLMEPATRSLNTKRSWNPGKDHIIVATYQMWRGDFSFGEYIVTDTEGNTKAVQPAFRKSERYLSDPERTMLYAYYWPAGSRDKKVNLQDQSTPEKLEAADILESRWPEPYGNYVPATGIATVSFYHALARIRLTLDEATINADEVAEVLIASETEVSLETRDSQHGQRLYLWGSNSGWISMCRDTDEANVFEALVASHAWSYARREGEMIKVRYRNPSTGETTESSVFFDNSVWWEGNKTYEYTISR